MKKDFLAAREMFEEDFGELLEGLLDEVRQNVQEACNALDDASEWSDELLNLVLAKLHGLKGITGQFSFSFVSTSVHKVEDVFANLKSKGEVPPNSYLQSLSEYISIVGEYFEEVNESKESDELDGLDSIAETLRELESLEGAKTQRKGERSLVVASDLKNYQLSQDVFQNIFRKMGSMLEGLKSKNAERELIKAAEENAFYLSQARTVPVNPVTKRVRKLVGELSQNLDKDINFIVEGEDAKIDRGIYSSLGEILVHLIKNAADHGLEDAEFRQKNGKSESGNLTLKFEINEEVSRIIIKDDGRGLDPEKIAEIALSKGVVSEDDLKLMTNYEKQFLIFAAGFSTKSAANEISGRGVGMDAVVKEVQKHGGSVSLVSDVGQGTSFILEWPVSFKLTDAVLFFIEGKLFSLPSRVVDFILVNESSFKIEDGAIEVFDSGGFYPLVDLRIGSVTATEPHCLVLNFDGMNVGLIVDQVYKCEKLFSQAILTSDSNSSLITGISQIDSERMALSIDVNELVSNINYYMSTDEGSMDVSEQTNVVEIKTENNLEGNMDLLKFESLGGGVTRQEIEEFLDDDKYIEEVKSILAPLQEKQDVYMSLLTYVANHFDSFRDVIKDVDVSDELEYMVAIKYAYLKADWIMYNVQIQYSSIAGEEVSEELMYKAALCSSMIGRFETITNPSAVGKITEVLAGPMKEVA